MSAPAQRNSHVIQLIASLILLLAAVVIFSNRQAIFDQIMVWQYRPSPAIAAIAERSELSEKGLFLFYTSQPQLLDRTAFNSVCRSEATEHTAVLGCYTRNQIYLFDIANKQLDGIKEVTAAHEMLHAAYQRLDSDERDRVDSLLKAQSFGSEKDRIKDLLEQYERTEPGERVNELHSILGTEVRDLNPELERYYARYFSDRKALVALSDQYQAVFAELKQRQQGLVDNLNALADEIEQRSEQYRRSLQALESDIRAFNSRAGSGKMSRAEYERERSGLEQRQMTLRSEYDSLRELVTLYETKRAELAAINSESEVLNRSVNSSVAPVGDGIDG